MFGFKGVGGYERGVARRVQVAPLGLCTYFTQNGYSLFLANPNVWRVGLATRPRSVFFAAYVGILEAVFNSFPFPARLFFFLGFVASSRPLCGRFSP